ncbi:hypothetical protein LCGC14_0487090 [marine sediment metagenome]|uniref:Recombination endonuclease VII n=1 Tax=marine sediment metagenome TaxID=412755 RepID=A0A0F9S7J9_9ZZZZ
MSRVGTKYCSRCDTRKSTGGFYRDRRRKDGLNIYCRECVSQQMKEYRKKNPDKNRRDRKNYRQKNRGEINRKKRVYRKTDRGRELKRRSELRCFYHMTLEQHRQLYENQKGRCGICRETLLYREVCTDHNHKTGEVRGLLCNHCNTGLGQFRDDPIKLKRAIKYLQRQR